MNWELGQPRSTYDVSQCEPPYRHLHLESAHRDPSQDDLDTLQIPSKTVTEPAGAASSRDVGPDEILDGKYFTTCEPPLFEQQRWSYPA